ncbi:hypothetical protein HD598_002148 [Neomicrococcus aestuarii]|uniref:Uncharacterized protein n=1 Tax=Neomicrococcus aestuarii TaxID=556325 RepID=A0A7W8TV51_9MICC|nr:hypothetical protein [Neomicrococcus aestuarii]MBB5513461.1 hypothetical protein [Neomicrococcus aestuarii]
MTKHYGRYEPGAWSKRYRICLVCGKVFRGYGMKPIIKKGGKP